MLKKILEIKDIEIGGATIVINNKKITKSSSPDEYTLIQAIRKDFPEIFGIISTELDLKYYDITIDSAMIIIRDENGKILISKKLKDTEYTYKYLYQKDKGVIDA